MVWVKNHLVRFTTGEFGSLSSSRGGYEKELLGIQVFSFVFPLDQKIAPSFAPPTPE